MKNFLLILIILLSGLLIAQFLMTGKHDSSVRQAAVQHETAQPATPADGSQTAAAARRTEQSRQALSEKTLARADRFQKAEPDQYNREGAVSLSEYNFNHAREYEAGEAVNYADNTDRSRESNVSQEQIDIVKKREEARKRRDQLLKMRAETIRTLDMEEGTDQQSAQ